MSENRKFTPEVLVTAPRVSAAVPNDEGKLALYTFSTYDLDTHTDFSEVKLLDLESGKTTRYSNNPKESSFRWLHKRSLLWQRESEKKSTELWIGDADNTNRPYLAGTIDAKLSDVKTHRLENGDIALVFTAAADADQNLYNASKEEKSYTTAREWTQSRPKRWDTYVNQYRSVIWYTVLKFDETSQKWHLSDKGPTNALRGTGLVVPLYTNSSSSADLDISTYGIAFATAKPGDTEWLQTQRSLYFLPLSTFEETEVPALKRIHIPGHADLVESPKFAPNSPVAAFLVAQDNEEWSPKSIGLLNVETLTITFLRTVDSADKPQPWDVFPDEILWSNDGSSLYLTANHQAQSRVFQIHIPPTPSETEPQTVLPRALTIPGSVSTIYPLSTGPSDPRLLATSSSFIDQGTFTIIDPTSHTQPPQTLHSTSSHGAIFGISSSQITSITFPGGPDTRTPIQTWIIKPSWFSHSSPEKHPLFLFMHGGPHSAVKDAWTWRWNALLLAEQGYIVAIPNFTGSDSFGGDFARAVSLQWGGHPYKDVERCFDWVEQNLAEKCDIDRAVAAGASFGGYMALYVAGQPLAKRLKALVCHDGVFDVVSELLADDLAEKQELTRSFGSPYFTSAADASRDPVAAKEVWRKWNPAEYLTNWATPLLVIHSDRDFRCPSTAGWAAYAVCRLKGIETRMLNFPDENHFVLGKENSLVWWRSVIAWCNRFVGVEGGPVLEAARNEPKWLGEVVEGRVEDVGDAERVS
ncbi:alpha/beta hydrolase family protein [Aspergillus ibericus CBS 121593]|uniref:Dipeptidyl-peptidase V n=1 Tax=Aspergillus ibericus CBS 121593 TaxID=1448316 RepID=A0A395GTG9_9EURO|nr:alpha/beta-hydrolase [Aspergillus ibericus CBS 121593]RAK98726.1 alpha/beta-hydrolase [Aspergillus ibericus CBS 121593]